MSSLFPAWSSTALRLALAGAACTFIGVPTALCIYVRTPYATHEGFEVVQPVQFDHRHHAGDDGIDCRYCHTTVERSPYAGLPSTATCMGCHGQIWNDSPALAPVRAAWASHQPIAWRRVHQLPDFVYFDHSAHVTRGVDCSRCHGRVDQMAQVRQVEPLTMGWCLRCHRDPGPGLAAGTRSLTSCSTCHR